MLGDQYSVADGYLFTVASWLQSDGVDIASSPRCTRTPSACCSARRAARTGLSFTGSPHQRRLMRV